MKVTMNLQTRDGTETKSKSFGNITTNYAFFAGAESTYPTPPSPEDAPSIELPLLPHGFASINAWVTAVGNAIATLSLNTYVDSTVQATWTMSEME